MTPDDPQVAAVLEAAALLEQTRLRAPYGYPRTTSEQIDHVEGLGALLHEVAHLLDQAGITADELGASLLDLGGRERRVLGELRRDHRGNEVTALVGARAVSRARARAVQIDRYRERTGGTDIQDQ